jgi:hypothetical protein
MLISLSSLQFFFSLFLTNIWLSLSLLTFCSPSPNHHHNLPSYSTATTTISSSPSSFLRHYRYVNSDDLMFVSLKKVGFLPLVTTFNLFLLDCLKVGRTDLVVRWCRREHTNPDLCEEKRELPWERERKRRWSCVNKVSEKEREKKLEWRERRWALIKLKNLIKSGAFIVAYPVQFCTG